MTENLRGPLTQLELTKRAATTNSLLYTKTVLIPEILLENT